MTVIKKYPKTIEQSHGHYSVNPIKWYKNFDDLDKIKANDNNDAICPVGDKNNDYNRPATITCTNFGFELPNNCKIEKIKVLYEHYKVNPDGTKKYISIAAPTVSLLNVDGVATGNAVPAIRTTYTNSFQIQTTSDIINSGAFGVEINYPANTSEHGGQLCLDFVCIEIEYSALSFALTQEIAQNEYLLGENVDITVKLQNTNHAIGTYTPRVNIILPAGLAYEKLVKGNGNVTQKNNLLIWDALMTNYSSYITIRVLTTTTGSKSIKASENTTNVNNTISFLVREEEIILSNTLEGEAVEGNTIQTTIGVRTSIKSPENILVNVPIPRGFILENYEVTGYGTYVNGVWTVNFKNKEAFLNLTLKCSTIGEYYQTISYKNKSITNSLSIIPSEFSEPYHALLKIDDEIKDRLADGINYTAVAYVKINDLHGKSPYNGKLNFRMGVYCEPNGQGTYPTLLTLISSANNVDEWTTLSLKAKLTDINSTPINEAIIHLQVDNETIKSSTTNNLGEADFTLDPLKVGSYDMKALFTGDYDYANVSSDNSRIIITEVQMNYIDTNLSITVDENTLMVGETTILRANLKDTDNNSIEGATVGFYEGNNLIGSSVTDVNGEATFNYSKNVGSTYSLNAKFEGFTEGRDSYMSSITSNIPVTFNKYNTNLKLVANYTTVHVGDNVILTATLTDENNIVIPNKVIKFMNNNNSLGQSITNNSGIATYTFNPSETTQYTINAIFDSDNKYNSSTKGIIINSIEKIYDLVSAPATKIGGSSGTYSYTPNPYEEGETIVVCNGWSKGEFKEIYSGGRGIKISADFYSSDTQTADGLQVYDGTTRHTIMWNMFDGRNSLCYSDFPSDPHDWPITSYGFDAAFQRYHLELIVDEYGSMGCSFSKIVGFINQNPNFPELEELPPVYIPGSIDGDNLHYGLVFEYFGTLDRKGHTRSVRNIKVEKL